MNDLGRRRPPRVAVQRLYARAAAVLDAEDTAREAEQDATAAAFLEEFRAQWRADAPIARPPATPRGGVAGSVAAGGLTEGPACLSVCDP